MHVKWCLIVIFDLHFLVAEYYFFINIFIEVARTPCTFLSGSLQQYRNTAQLFY